MATPANRVPVRIARGTKANLDTAVAAGDLKEGEVCYATDENSIYVIEGGVLTQAGADLSAASIDALSDVDTSTVAPTDGQVLTWNNTDSEWQPADAAGGGGGASTLADLTDTDGIPVASETQKLLGKWNEGEAGDDQYRPGPGKYKNTVSRFYFSTTDADGQDVTTPLTTVLSTDKLQIATDSGFTNLVYNGEVGDSAAVSDTGTGPHYRFNGNPSIGTGLAGSGTVYVRVFAQTVTPTVEDGKVLMWDQSTTKWSPGSVAIPDKALDDLTDVSSGVSVSLMNFDLADGTGTNFEPLDDEVATAADDGLQWVGVFSNDGVSNAQVKFGSGALDLNTSGGLLEWPAVNNSTTYATWSPRWALGDSDFTMELWWYFPSGGTTSDRTFLHWADNSNYDSNAIEWFYKHDGLAADAAFKVIYTEEGQTHTEVTFTIGSFITTDAWHHLALCRDGANLRAFLDGTQVDATHNIGTKVIRTPSYNSGTSRFRLGDSNRENRPCRGYIDGWSYAKTANYTTSFTAPVAAPAVEPIPEGSILVYENGLWQSSTSGPALRNSADLDGITLEDGAGLIYDAVNNAFKQNQAPADSLQAMAYKFKNTTSGDPGTGKVALNNADPTLATEIRASKTTENGVDMTFIFDMAVGTAQAIYIQRKDNASEAHAFRTTGPAVDSGTYVSVPVEHVNGTGTFTNNKSMMVGVYASGVAGALSPVSVPSTATSAGTAGDIRYDAGYVYICVATNTWKRAALAAW